MKNKKIIKLISYIVFILMIFSFGNFVLGEELESNNFKMSGFSVGAGGGDEESNNYRTFTFVGDPAMSENLASSSYKQKPGRGNVWQANVPLMKCFVSGVDPTGDCEDPDFSGGLEALCGGGGCTDKAHFEVDIQSNPTDALYAIHIKKSTDSEWGYVDGSTNLVETDWSARTIDDYKTKADWESIDFNILGLEPDTTYEARATALRGDFTESEPGPLDTADTTNYKIQFDLDIADSGGSAAETSGPYEIDFGDLSTTGVNTANDRIWIDISMNAQNGVQIFIEDQNNGLAAVSSTIASNDVDLSSINEGFGLQSATTAQGSGGPLTAVSPFNGSGENVGGVSTSSVEIYNSSGGEIEDGRASVDLKTKISSGTPAGSYSDLLTFSVIGTF
ncbi:hypothetical protein GF362_05500 [Candidatus Dojkabacteria bacterium]|nr:hypothetical protein [Candidatus Dojkabacteria bacterium]